MLSHLQRLFRKSSSSIDTNVPAEFSSYTDQAIHLITSSDGQLEDSQIIALLEENGIPHTEAIELLLFLPIAFCRHLLPVITWPNHYFEFISQEKRIKHLYTDNKRYILIQEALQRYLAGNFIKTDYYKIAGRSASFHSINQIILDNPGRKLSELLVTPETVIY